MANLFFFISWDYGCNLRVGGFKVFMRPRPWSQTAKKTCQTLLGSLCDLQEVEAMVTSTKSPHQPGPRRLLRSS